MVTTSLDLTRREILERPPSNSLPARLDRRAAVDGAARLRFEVYCREPRFLEERHHPDGREGDEFDAHSLHFRPRRSADKPLPPRLLNQVSIDMPD